MASLKETRITNLRIMASVDDHDPSNVIYTAMAQTRTTDGLPIVEYIEDISDMVSEEDTAVLEPLLQRVFVRIMTDRSISQADLEEGAKGQAQRVAELEQVRLSGARALAEAEAAVMAAQEEASEIVPMDQIPFGDDDLEERRAEVVKHQEALQKIIDEEVAAHSVTGDGVVIRSDGLTEEQIEQMAFERELAKKEREAQS